MRFFVIKIFLILSFIDARANDDLLKDSLPLDSAHNTFKISRSWNLPPVLQNISAFDFIDAGHLACIQAAIGSIFIFDLAKKSIETEIPFASPGDYKGIAIVDNSAFVACADGRILEIAGYRSEKPTVKEYGTNLTVRDDVEGVCYDKKNARLLVCIRGDVEEPEIEKGIYAFDLASRQMPIKPVLSIDLRDTIINKGDSKRLQTLILPSDIDIDPLTNWVYVCDATKSQVLVMDENGKMKSLFIFDRDNMVQPEGIRFTPSGELYIASEGFKDSPGKILMIASAVPRLGIVPVVEQGVEDE
jgi:DNA-binding beta-propeller fold protein YncE